MTGFRAVLALTLAGSALLPYAAPAVCSALRADMSAPHMAMHDDVALSAQAAASPSCDFGECATAPVAPVTAFVTSSTVVPTVDVALSIPTDGSDIDPSPPLTPPPIA